MPYAPLSDSAAGSAPPAVKLHPPVLLSEHLEFLPLIQADIVLLRLHWSRPEVRRSLRANAELSEELMHDELQAALRSADIHCAGLWKVRHVATRGFVGVAGLVRAKGSATLEFRCSVEPLWRGQGFGLEVGRRLLRYAFDELGLDRIRACPAASTAAAKQFLRRIGFTAADGEAVPVATASSACAALETRRAGARPFAQHSTHF